MTRTPSLYSTPRIFEEALVGWSNNYFVCTTFYHYQPHWALIGVRNRKYSHIARLKSIKLANFSSLRKLTLESYSLRRQTLNINFHFQCQYTSVAKSIATIIV